MSRLTDLPKTEMDINDNSPLYESYVEKDWE